MSELGNKLQFGLPPALASTSSHPPSARSAVCLREMAPPTPILRHCIHSGIATEIALCDERRREVQAHGPQRPRPPFNIPPICALMTLDVHDRSHGRTSVILAPCASAPMCWRHGVLSRSVGAHAAVVRARLELTKLHDELSSSSVAPRGRCHAPQAPSGKQRRLALVARQRRRLWQQQAAARRAGWRCDCRGIGSPPA